MIKTGNKHFLFSILLLIFFTEAFTADRAKAQNQNLKNDVFWNTKDGRPMYSQGGGIFRFADPVTKTKKYYWYGVHYLEAEVYRDAPFITQKTNTFEAVTCYSSTDLVNWTFEANVLNVPNDYLVA